MMSYSIPICCRAHEYYMNKGQVAVVKGRITLIVLQLNDTYKYYYS